LSSSFRQINTHTHTQSQNSDRNLMSTSTNTANRLNEQLYADQSSCWNVQYRNTTQLHTDRNITVQWHEHTHTQSQNIHSNT